MKVAGQLKKGKAKEGNDEAAFDKSSGYGLCDVYVDGSFAGPDAG
jgi:hypothetical protein